MENVADLSRSDTSSPDMTLFDLPLDIHYEIFSYLDIHDQPTCRQAWQTWNSFPPSLHIRIDLKRCADNPPQMLIGILQETISQSTKSLILCETRPRMNVAQLTSVITVLSNRGIKVPRIILSHRYCWLNSMVSGDPILQIYAQLQDVCDKLYWRLEHPFRRAHRFCARFNRQEGAWYHVRYPDIKLNIK